MSEAVDHPRQTIETEQLRRLRRLIGAIAPTNRFYAPRLEAAGIDANVADLETFRSRMPLTCKDQLVADQQAHPPFGTNLTYPLDRYCRFHQTSGTTGAPMRWLDTAESWQGLLESWKRVYRAAGVTESDRVLLAFSFGPFLGFWAAYDAAGQMGCLVLAAGGMSSAARLGLMLDASATVVCCTPTYALRLGEVAANEGVDLAQSAVRVIIVAGEPGGSVPAVRRRITDAWGGARVFDHHGMTEVGPVTYEHPRRPGVLRIIEESYLAEVIDPKRGEAIDMHAPGAMGELVLTTLDRAASPLLRYRTGDLVRPIFVGDDGTDAADGPHLALDGGILGRADDMALVRGVNVYPSAIDRIVRDDPRVAEYRVKVDTAGAMTELEVTVEATAAAAQAGDDATLAEAIAAALRDALALRVPVTLAPPGSLPRFEMKAQRWIRT